MKTKYRSLGLPLLCILGMLMLTSLGFSQKQSKPSMEIRGLWVVRHTMKDSLAIRQMLKTAASIGITDLFVQVRGRGDAFYETNMASRAEGLTAGFDPLAFLFREPAASRFRIHAWLNVYYLWSAEHLPNDSLHIVYQQPQWLAYPASYDPGDTVRVDYQERRNIEGLYLSPHVAEVNQHLIQVVEDIVLRYPVAGVHLDYIRFADQQYDLHPLARQRFREQYFVDPLEFKIDPNRFVNHYGPTGYEIFYSRWGQFQRDAVSGFVRQLSQRLRERKPALFISAAVKPEIYKAHWQFYQEWNLWLKKGWIDYAIPMNYAPANSLFNRRSDMINKVADKSKILMGISLYNQSPTGVLQKIDQVRRQNLPGFVLFSYDTILQNRNLRQLLNQR